jgi:WD40 repeat protein/serine/threonine protein kinase
MTTHSDRDAARIFEAALEREPKHRAAFLDAACGGDRALRAEVESLLEADGKAEGFLEPPHYAAKGAGDSVDPRIGTSIGQYRIQRVIAAGGMGTVYEAVQEQPQRTVALKIIRPGMSSRSALRRFKNEAETLGRLRHPGIAQVYEAGTHGGEQGIPYFAMEHIPGGKAITQYAEEYGLSTRKRLGLFAKVCDAVHHGHQRGIIHRDLKPGNILADEHGQPRVIDFGVARATDVDVTIATLQTDVGELIGTLRYMSPEQCEGDAIELDTRSDVYSLGVVLFELLTGELPYDFTSTPPFEAPRIIREQEPRRLSAVNRVLPGDVETIVLKALEKDRERRYQSASDLAQDIRRYLDHKPIEAKRGSRLYVLRKTLRRHRITAAVASGFAAVLVFSAVGLALLYRDSEQQRRIAAQNAEQLRRAAYLNNIALAQQAHAAANTADLVSRLAQCPPDLRSWEWHYLKRLSDTSLMTLRGHTSSVQAVVFLDEETIASAGWDKTIRIWDTSSGGQVRTFWSGDVIVERLAISPDNRRLAGSGREDDVARVWDLKSGKLLHVLRGHRRPVQALAFSPDSRMLATGSEDGTLRLWEVDSGASMHEFDGFDGYAVAWIPDGRRVVTGGSDATAIIWDAQAGEPLEILSGHTLAIKQVAVDPTGAIVASTSWDNTLRIWDGESGAPLRTIEEDMENSLALAFAPNGEGLAVSTVSALRVWNVDTGIQEAARLGHVGTIQAIAYSPDGSRIATAAADRTVKLWDAVPRDEPPTLMGHEAPINSVAVSPDGRQIVSADRDGAIRLSNIGDYSDSRVLGSHVTRCNSVSFSPNGDFVLSGGFDRAVRLWRVSDDAEVDEPIELDSAVFAVECSPSCEQVAVALGSGNVQIIQLDDRRVLWSQKAHEGAALDVSFSPDGQTIATSGQDAYVRIWNAKSGELLRGLRTKGTHVNRVTFSPSGRLVAAGGGDNAVRIWDTATGDVVHVLEGHPSVVLQVVFLPDESRLLSSCYGHLIKMWDVDSGQIVLTLRGHDQPVADLASSPDGRWFVSASHDKTLRIWDSGGLDRRESVR